MISVALSSARLAGLASNPVLQVLGIICFLHGLINEWQGLLARSSCVGQC